MESKLSEELVNLVSEMSHKYAKNQKQREELHNDLVAFADIVQKQLCENIIEKISK